MELFLYFIEILRYFVGNKIFFDGSMKRWRVAIIGGVIYYITVVNNLNLFKHEVIYLMAYIFAGISAFFMIEETRGKKLFKVISLLCIFACLDEIVGMVIIHMCEKLGYTMEEESIIQCLITLGILLFMYLIKLVIGKQEYQRGKWKENTIVMLIIFMSLCLTCMVGGLVYTQRFMNNQEETVYLNVVGMVSYECVIALVLFMIYIKDTNEKKEQLIETERMLGEMQKKYYIELLEKEEETRRYRHDMNNHLICLYEFINSKENAKAIKYIEKLQEKLCDIRKKCYYTGNEVLDILLNNHLSLLKNTEISVVGKCKHVPDISNVDFCIIFSNLIKNAVEELERESQKKKYIRVNIQSGRKYLMIEIKNTSSLIIGEKRTLIRTKKSDKKNHGIGLRNVQEIVEKNGGSFYFTGDGEEVSAKVILNIKE